MWPGIVSQLLSFVAGLFGNQGLNIWNGVSGTADQSFSSLNNSFLALGEAAAKIKDVFKSIWDDVILVMLKKLLEAYQKLRELLQRIFGPVVRFLQRLRALYDSYFNKFVKPMLNIIRQVRRVLQVFRLLGFKWAARLDARLADVENKIIKAYELIRQNLNQVTSWLQLVIDPTFILRRNPLFAAIIRSAPELRNLMLTSVTRQLTPDEQAKQDAARARYSLSSLRDRQSSYYSSGQLPPDLAASRQLFQSKLGAAVNQ